MRIEWVSRWLSVLWQGIEGRRKGAAFAHPTDDALAEGLTGAVCYIWLGGRLSAAAYA